MKKAAANTVQKSKKGEKKPPKKITATYLHNAGLFYLQKFSTSKKHFETVLMRKVKKSCMHHTDQDLSTCAALVAETVEKFERAGLLNDQVYAQGMASSLRRNGKSKNLILQKMNHKGVGGTLARETLEDFDVREHGDNKTSEENAAIKFARKKKLAGFANPPRPATQKDLATFARAGFSYDLARKILKADIEELENINS